MKKIFLVLVLFAIGFNSVFAQQNSSITLVNNTGVDVRMIIIRQSGSNSMFNMYSYGYNPLANGRAVTLNLETPLNGVNRYDIELEDVNGRKHIRNNVSVSANARIEIGPLPPQANPSITIVNNTGNAINAFYLRRNGSGYWEKYTFNNNQTINNRQSFTFQLPFSIDVVNQYDIRLERPNRLGTYTKNTVRVSAGNRIDFTPSDVDNSRPQVNQVAQSVTHQPSVSNTRPETQPQTQTQANPTEAQLAAAEAAFGRGNSALREKNYDRAIAEYSEAIRLYPNYANAYFRRGGAYALKDDDDRAIADFTQAIRLVPNYVNAYYGRGLVYGAKDDFDRARADFEAVLRINPNHADAKRMLEIMVTHSR